jgi:hypothetical protein
MRIGWRWVLLLTCAAACNGAEGALWYTAGASGQLLRVDLSASPGDSTYVDVTRDLGIIAVDPSSGSVAYRTKTGDPHVYVADRAGAVTELLPSPNWIEWEPGGWLWYFVANADAVEVAIAHPPDAPRIVDATGRVAFSADGAHVAYVTSANELVVDRAAGGERQVIATLAGRSSVTFAPGDRALLVTTAGHITEYAIATGATSDRGSGTVFVSARSPQSASYEQQVLVASPGMLEVLSLANNQRRQIATLPAQLWSLDAFFAPDGTVIYSIAVNLSTSDPVLLVQTLGRFQYGMAKTLDSAFPNSVCRAVALSHDGRYMAADCHAMASVFELVSDRVVLSVKEASSIGFDVSDQYLIVQKPDGRVMRVAGDGQAETVAYAAAGNAAIAP